MTALPNAFCKKCLHVCDANPSRRCPLCGSELGTLTDPDGAMSREFLLARGFCCENRCRNCPYQRPTLPPRRG